MKPTLEDEIRQALVMYYAQALSVDRHDRDFCECFGYIPDCSWLPKRYAGLIMWIIAKHLDKKPKKK